MSNVYNVRLITKSGSQVTVPLAGLVLPTTGEVRSMLTSEGFDTNQIDSIQDWVKASDAPSDVQKARIRESVRQYQGLHFRGAATKPAEHQDFILRVAKAWVGESRRVNADRTNPKAVPADKLNDLFEFDQVIEVDEDGKVSERLDLYAPDVSQNLMDDGFSHDGEPYIDGDEAHSWELLRGFTGQHGYNGATLHSSEFVGGGLAKHILANPGLYVATVPVELHDEEGDYSGDGGWVIAHRAI